ncbi:hypothetical protein MKQ70_17675 [Chitinophaga sedimenti]|uniref:pirin family protein n=1 Tax=Chitinophaga sedimenti TaxID=2033606 RepID=UPI00200561D2|nr:hypothetical protein [Chitinophaga sedimenti]MCK7556749.1 hypothetical protein [Chitinophaga sedimenti]
MGRFDKGFTTNYKVHKPGNGVYVFVINGEVTIDNTPLGRRDGLGIWDKNTLQITSGSQDAEVLLMDVPMMIS